VNIYQRDILLIQLSVNIYYCDISGLPRAQGSSHHCIYPYMGPCPDPSPCKYIWFLLDVYIYTYVKYELIVFVYVSDLFVIVDFPQQNGVMQTM